MNAIDVSILSDDATPAIGALQRALIRSRVQRAVGTACTLLTKNHLNTLPPNKMGWPSSGFYKKAARNTEWNPSTDGVVISTDSPEAPGAMRQRYHGGTINMKDKMLTIPAGPQFYNQRATMFTNLRYVRFGVGGPQALVVGTAGTDLYDFYSNQEKRVKGAGPRAVRQARTRGQLIIAFWLKESVTQAANPDVIPSPQEYLETGKAAVIALINDGRNN